MSNKIFGKSRETKGEIDKVEDLIRDMKEKKRKINRELVTMTFQVEEKEKIQFKSKVSANNKKMVDVFRKLIHDYIKDS